MKKKSKIILILCFVFSISISFMLGHYMSNDSSVKRSILFNDVPQNELSIINDFIELETLTYSIKDGKDYIETSISLNDKGEKYACTNLFINDYDITITLINNTTNEEDLTISNLDWNINSQKKFTLPIEKDKITDEEKLKDLNSLLEQVKKGDESHLIYAIQISPKVNSDNIMRFIGVVEKK